MSAKLSVVTSNINVCLFIPLRQFAAATVQHCHGEAAQRRDMFHVHQSVSDSKQGNEKPGSFEVVSTIEEIKLSR